MEIEEGAHKESPDERSAAQPNEFDTEPGELDGPDEQTNNSDAEQEIEVPPMELQDTTDAEQETANLPDEKVSAPDADALALGSAPTRKTSKYTRWFQALAVVLLICVIGGVVLVAQAGQRANGHGQVVQISPTPTPPLKVTAWCITNGAQVDPQAGQASLDKVAALSSNDAWILGSTDKGNNFNGNTGRHFPLLEHWNGQTWSVVPTADTSALLKHLLNKVGGGQASYQVDLNDMAVLSDTDIWAVGSISVQKLGQAPQSWFAGMTINTAGQPLIEHWNGSTWQIVASPGGSSGVPGPASASNQLTSISAVSANDIWALGSQAARTNAPQSGNGFVIAANAPLVEHWNGVKWMEKQLPASLQKGGLPLGGSIQAISANDVWSFNTSALFNFSSAIHIQQLKPGTLPPGSPPGVIVVSKPVFVKPLGASTATSHILHWNGQSWNEMRLPSSLSKNTLLGNVTVISDNNIWLLGTNSNPKDKKNEGANVIYHWDGSAWSSVTNAPGVDPKSHLDSLSVIAPDNIWMMGRTVKNQPLLEHWDGKAWSPVAPTSPAYGSATSLAVAGKHAWALVDEYTASDAQKVSSFGIPNTTKEVLEVNC